MVSANIALIIMIVVILLLALILPLLDSVKGFKDSISTRWSIVVVYLALGIGCVIDFEKLGDDTRHFVLLGCFVISILYIVFVSIEKWFSNKWIGKFGVTLKKGESFIHAGVSNTDTKAEGHIPESPVTAGVDMGIAGKPSKSHEHKNQETEEASDTENEQSPSCDELDMKESDASEELNEETEEDGEEEKEA